MKLKSTILLASLLCIAALNAQEQEKPGLFQRLINKVQNILKTQEQTAQERAAERAKQVELRRLKAMNEHCGTNCKANEICCVIPGNGVPPSTYCATSCGKGAHPVS